MSVIVVSTIILCSCGLLAGAALAIASRLFAVEVDERIEKIEAILPGANCSGCGNPSCFVYALAIVNDGAPLNRCVMLNAEAVAKIGTLMGQEVSVTERQVAAIRCYGGPASKKLFEYGGYRSCRIAAYYSHAGNACQYNCMTLGSCYDICPFDAIDHSPGTTPKINRNRCTGCGKCVKECPKRIIQLVPVSARPFVACSSRDKGKVVRELCPIGCISCKKCVKTCPAEAIVLKDGIIDIDYTKCTACGDCIGACPRKIIYDLHLQEPEAQKAATS